MFIFLCVRVSILALMNRLLGDTQLRGGSRNRDQIHSHPRMRPFQSPFSRKSVAGPTKEERIIGWLLPLHTPLRVQLFLAKEIASLAPEGLARDNPRTILPSGNAIAGG